MKKNKKNIVIENEINSIELYGNFTTMVWTKLTITNSEMFLSNFPNEFDKDHFIKMLENGSIDRLNCVYIEEIEHDEQCLYNYDGNTVNVEIEYE